MEGSLLILYGSVNGNAEAISMRIHEDCKTKGISSRWMACNQAAEEVDLEKETLILIVCSTTGEGDIPDNARKLWRILRKKTHPRGWLNHLKYGLLALGDTNYDRFCNAGKTLDALLSELGATPFCERGEADDATGMEDVVEPWIERIWSLLIMKKVTCNSPPVKTQTKPDIPEGAARLLPCLVKTLDDSSCPIGNPPTLQKCVHAQVKKAFRMTSPDSDREVLHLELDLGEQQGEAFLPGDSLAVICPNRESDVNYLIDRLRLDGDRVLSFGSTDPSADVPPYLPTSVPCTVRQALSYCCDFHAVPKKTFLRMLAEHTKDNKEQAALLHLCSKGGAAAYKTEILGARVSLQHLLSRFPSCHPPLAQLMYFLPPLAPRYYSMSNSPLKYGVHRVHFAFTVVKEGLCTQWMKKQCTPILENPSVSCPIHLPVFLNPANTTGAFRVPMDVAQPVLMIGPGTGVSPFVGFAQHRQHQLEESGMGVGDGGEMWLYFGCRRRNEDYLYQETLEKLHNSGVIKHLHVAFSREQEEKVYVQHLMKQHADQLRELILGGAYIYVCGDGFSMSKDVNEALTSIIQTGGMSSGDARSFLKKLTKEGRYVRDIWS